MREKYKNIKRIFFSKLSSSKQISVNRSVNAVIVSIQTLFKPLYDEILNARNICGAHLL